MKKSGIVLKTCRYAAFAWIAAVLFLTGGCRKEKPEPESESMVYKYINELYYYVYYWNREMDGYIAKDPPLSGSAEEYFESLKYEGDKVSASDKAAGRYDRWGFMASYLDYYGLLVEGVYKSFGYNLDIAPDGSVRVSLVYENSPMHRAGVERGYSLLKINGKDMATLLAAGRASELDLELNRETNRFVFADREGNTLPEKTVSAAVMDVNPILTRKTYNANGKKVGYIAYNSFIVASKNHITAALRDMKDVDEFVLDLRYNGGGSVDVAESICECLLPQSADADSVIFAKYVFSDLTKQRLKWKDEISKIKRSASAMNLSRIFIITTDMTASASEEVINGMKPFLDVVTVGAATHGKAVGMGVWFYPPYNDTEIASGKIPEWVFAPITFRGDNSNDEGGYFLGIPANYEVADDLYHDFGVDDATLQGEACLQYILEYVKSGSFPQQASAKAVNREKPEALQLKGLQIQAGCR